MKKNELRLGNIVADRNGFEMFVDGVFRDVVYLDWDGNEGDVWEEKYEDIKGVKLTEEHLTRFGFEYDEEFDGFILFLDNKKQIGYSYGVLYYMGVDEPYWVDVLSGNIYLHQLQNIVFELSRKELTIKE